MLKLMLFSAVLSGILFITSAFITQYGTDAELSEMEQLNDDLGNDIDQTTGEIEDDTRNIDTKLEAGLFYLRGAIDAILSLFSLFLVIPSVGATIAGALNLPGWVGELFSIMFMAALITLIYEARRS
jgi:hypothetical protein